MATQFCFLPLFACTHRFLKLVIYTTVELLRLIPIAVIGLFRFKFPFIRKCVSGKVLSLDQSVLKDRKQRTVLNGQCSNWGDVLAGVPQGSILGPLFFLVYINDLTVDLKCHVKVCVDDTSLFTVVKSLTQLLRT